MTVPAVNLSMSPTQTLRFRAVWILTGLTQGAHVRGRGNTVDNRERFRALMKYEPIDRMPLYYFGTWPETKERWAKEGLEGVGDTGRSTGPQLPEMDPDWEEGLWHAHGLVNVNPISDEPCQILEDTVDYRIVRTSLGAVSKVGKHGSSIDHHVEEALKPTRDSWQRFRQYIDADTSARRPADGFGRRTTEPT